MNFAGLNFKFVAMVVRVKCVECDNMILPQTAANNGGLCGQCVKMSPELRAEKRKYEQRLADRLVFIPSDEERASSATPDELTSGGWQLQPEYYAGGNVASPMDAIAAAKLQSEGNVFLVTDAGGELNLGFTECYGLCEYQNPQSGDYRYAYTESNLCKQAPPELHVIQACSCCGVGMLWYPSRFHMPRDKAFSILEDAVAKREAPGVQWLKCDDFSYTERGRG